ncbi:MAG TPA: MraY family glycosyltransferase [Thermoanaerobaculia bacterium]|nr:MraY family glycosyltransferase [Thermoanaerobaculia bacterium]
MTPHFVPLLLLFVASGLTSFVATGIVKGGAVRIGLVDEPGDRKHHRVATPRLGGLAIIFGFGFPLLILAADARAAELVTKNLQYLFAVLSSGSLILGLGIYDDLLGANAPKKFIVQTAAAIILVSFGFKFDYVSFGGSVVNLGVLGWVASVLWIVGVINALNFIDGIDSLATVVSITIAVSFGIIAILRYDIFSLVIMVALAGSLIGFYPWNKPPAKIFMGDSGSLFIGLLLAACSIARPSKSPTALIIGGPMLALALPVIDTLFVMRARIAGKHSSWRTRLSAVFTADRNHIHHILIGKYGSIAKVIFGIWSVTLLFAIAAVMTVLPTTKPIGYAAAVLALLVLVVMRFRQRRPTDEEIAESLRA